MRLSLVSSEGGLSRVRCEGQITFADIKPGRDALEDVLGPDCHAGTVLLDLEATEFIDSAGIGWLVGSHRRFKAAGGKLVIHSVPPMIDHVFQLLRMPSLLHLADDEKAARALAVGEKS